MNWVTWLIAAILTVPVAAFLSGFTYRIIEETCKAIIKPFGKKIPDPIPVLHPTPITQPIWTIPHPNSVVPYNRIRGYFPSDN